MKEYRVEFLPGVMQYDERDRIAVAGILNAWASLGWEVKQIIPHTGHLDMSTCILERDLED